MNKRVLSLMTLLVLLVGIYSVVASSGSVVPHQDPTKSRQPKPRKLNEIALDREVEVEGADLSHGEAQALQDLSEAKAIVYARIIDSKSFFDESSPQEKGENITTEYAVEVLRVLKDKTSESMPPPERAHPAPLTTPLKISRNGGAVYVNGHRAAVKVKGYERLYPGSRYVFFLYWSPDYEAYILAHGISGAVMVEDDLSLKSLGSSKEIDSKLRGMNLDSLINEIK